MNGSNEGDGRSPPRSRELQGVLFAAVAIVIVVLALYIYVQYNLFWPTERYVWRPDIPYSEITINNLCGWLFQNHPGRPTVLFCHGNAGNISHRGYVVELCHRMQLNLLLFDYRGFGQSAGYATCQGVCNDAEMMYLYLRQNGLKDEEIVVWGESLGGAAAVYVASKHPCRCLILLSTFSSLQDIALTEASNGFMRAMIPSLFAVMDEIPSRQRLEEVRCPVVIMHSRDDDLIPFINAVKNYEVVRTEKKFIQISGSHSNPTITVDNLREAFEFGCIDGSRCELTADILEAIRHFDGQHTRK